MKNILLEALNPSRLMTGESYLQLFDGKAADIYQDKEAKVKYACKLLGLKDASNLLIYPAPDPGLYTKIKIHLKKVDQSTSLKNVVKKIFKQAVSMRFTEIDLSQKIETASGKAMLCPTFNCVIFQDSFAFKDRGSFTKFSEFLEAKDVNTDLINDDIAKEDPKPLSAEERDDYGNLQKIIHISKTEAGKYTVIVAQLPELASKRFDTAIDAEKYAKAALTKNGYKEKEFRIEGSFATETKTNRSVSKDNSGRITAFNFSIINDNGETETISEDPKNLAFIIDGKIYGYKRYQQMNTKQKKQVIIVKRSGLVGQTIIESLHDFVDLETYLPDYLDIIENSEKYIINNKETGEKVSVNISGNTEKDCREIIYSLYKITGGKLDLKNFINELNERENEQIVEATNSTIDNIEYMSVEDLLSNMFGNVSEKQLDKEITKFKKFARILHVKEYGDMLVMVSEGEHDPSNLFPEGRYHLVNEFTGEHEMYFDEQGIVAEYHKNRLIYIYFANEDIMKKFIAASNEFLRSFEIEENPFVKEDLEISDVMSIEECLNILDKNSNNRFDLLNCYLSENFTNQEKCKIAEIIKEGYSNDSIQKYLKEKVVDKDFILTEKDHEDEISEEDMSIEQLLFAVVEDQEQESGSISVYDKMSLDKAVDWLTTRGYDYDIQQIEEDGWELFWMKKLNASAYGDSSDAVNKTVAQNILDKIREVQDMLRDIVNESSATQSAASYDQDIQELLQAALDEAKKFDY